MGTFSDPTFVPRLSWAGTLEKSDYEATELCEIVASARDVAFFCDNSLFDDATPSDLYDALFAVRGRTYLTPRVEEELAPWLERRPSHVVDQALSDGTTLQVMTVADWSDAEQQTFIHYVNLLALRKRMMHWVELEFERAHGRKPDKADAEAMRGLVHKALGERGFLFAKKGALERAKGVSYADEEAVYTAVAHALRTGDQTVILTKDEDLLDQFYRLVYLLDTHYRSMLIAETYLKEFGRFRTHPMPTFDEYRDTFTGNGNVLVEREPDLPARVLPEDFTFVAVSCWLVGHRYSGLTFGAECEMQKLVQVKGRTRGMNTDVLGKRNCHLALTGLSAPRGDMAACFAIAEDRTHDIAGQQVPHLEFVQGAAIVERFERYEENSGRLLRPNRT